MRSLVRWETLLFVVLLILVVGGTAASPVFLSGRNFTNLTAAVIEVSIMALPMALVIIAGEIDLSVESMAGLSCAVVGWLFMNGVPVEVAIPLALVARRGRRAAQRRARHRLRPAVARRHPRARSPSTAASRSSSSARRA